MRVAIVGGTAFIGAAIVRELAAAGHELLVFHRGLTMMVMPEGVGELAGDRRDLYEFRPKFHDFGPDVVIDTVCMTEHQAQTTVDTFVGVAKRLIVLSSQDVYRAFGRVHGREPGPPDHAPITEESPLREQLFPYRGSGEAARFDWSEDYEKIVVEQIAQSEPSLPGTFLRLPAVFGPGDYQHRLFGYARRIADGRPAIVLERGVAEWRWTRGYVGNIAAATRLAVENDRAAGETYNLGELHTPSEIEWVQAIGDAMGWRGKIVVVEDERFAVGIDTSQQLVVDTGKVRRHLGFEAPVALDDAVKRTVAWELDNPPDGYAPSSHQYEAEDAVIADIEDRLQA